MLTERKLFLIDVGEISIKKRKSSHRMSLRVKPGGDVNLNIPYFVSFSEGEKYLNAKKEWIIRSKEKLARLIPEKTIYNINNLPHTKYHEFIFTKSEKDKLRIKISQGLAEIVIPVNLSTESDEVQDFIALSIIETLRKEAKIILVQRTWELAKKHNFKINRIFIKNMKTRWGSCSTEGNINLNLHLMSLPDHLINYVILHELAHTIQHNHSQLFWSELDKYTGNAKLLAKELRNWGKKIQLS